MVQVIQVIKVTQVVQVVWVVQVVRVAGTTSLDDMHSENIWFSWQKPSKYREKLICHACDGRTDERTNGRTDGKWKIEQCFVGPETAIMVDDTSKGFLVPSKARHWIVSRGNSRQPGLVHKTITIT